MTLLLYPLKGAAIRLACEGTRDVPGGVFWNDKSLLSGEVVEVEAGEHGPGFCSAASKHLVDVATSFIDSFPSMVVYAVLVLGFGGLNLGEGSTE